MLIHLKAAMLGQQNSFWAQISLYVSVLSPKVVRYICIRVLPWDRTYHVASFRPPDESTRKKSVRHFPPGREDFFQVSWHTDLLIPSLHSGGPLKRGKIYRIQQGWALMLPSLVVLWQFSIFFCQDEQFFSLQVSLSRDTERTRRRGYKNGSDAVAAGSFVARTPAWPCAAAAATSPSAAAPSHAPSCHARWAEHQRWRFWNLGTVEITCLVNYDCLSSVPRKNLWNHWFTT